jgi:hypothetical protein
MKTYMRFVYIFILLFPILAFAVEPPKQATLNEETAFQIDLGGAKASVKIPAGTVVDVVSVGTDSILLKRGKATAEIPISATDYASRNQALIDQENAQQAAVKKAQEDRQAAEDAAKKKQAEESSARQAALIEKAGKKPVVTKDPFSGEITIPRAMAREIKNRLKDPDSFQPRGVHKLEIVEKNGVACWEVGITYAAKNGFGGYTMGTATALMRGSELFFLDLGK